MGGEPARVVNGAAGNDETHGPQRYSTGGGPRDSPWKTPVRSWLIVGLLGVRYVRILLVPSPYVAYRINGRSRCVYSECSISRMSLTCPATPEVWGCERRTHVARRLTGPTREGRARRGRRSRIRRLRPDLPALRMGDDQLPGGSAEGGRRQLRRQPDAPAGRAGTRTAAACARE